MRERQAGRPHSQVWRLKEEDAAGAWDPDVILGVQIPPGEL